MSAKVNYMVGLVLLVVTHLTMAQGVKTTEGNGGVSGPSEEGGGTPSTSWSTNANGLHVNGYSKIGIGTLLPERKLDILGAGNTVLRLTANGGIGTHVSGIEFKRVAGQVTDNWDIVNQSALRIRKSGVAVVSFEPQNTYIGTINDRMTINVWGKEVEDQSGEINDGSIMIKNNISGADMNLRVDANQLESSHDLHLNYFSDRNVDLVHGGGKVRVGTFDDGAKFNVSDADEMQLKLINPGQGGGAWHLGVANNAWTAGPGKLIFSNTNKSGDATMVLTPAGNVGIGLTTPSKMLHVNGVTSTKVLEITGGADFAENFDITESEALAPGTVVSINTNESGKLRIADKAYDKTVAGIISGAGGIQPGMLMGQDGTIANGKYPVALNGRVYCLVDATYGEIKPGDLLTTSDTAGHAMKVDDREKSSGAIIGKAMTSLKEGKGLVLVLVSLQ